MNDHFIRGANDVSIRAEDLDVRVLEDGAISSRRKTFVKDWMKARQRRAAQLAVGGLMALPLIVAADDADAQAAPTPIPVTSLNGVSAASLNANGSLQLTLVNGQVMTVAASEVTVLANGAIAVSAATAELVATLAGVGLAGAAGIGAVAAAAGGGLAAAVVAAAVGGGGDSAPGPVVGAVLPGGGALSAGELLANQTFTGFAPAGSQVSITINGVTQTAVADGDGNYSITFTPAQLPATNGGYEVVIVSEELDDLGAPTGNELGRATTTLTVDVTPPVLAITTPILTDNVVNIAEAAVNQTISGTTDAENGQIVTVTLNGQDYLGIVANGVWTITVPSADLQALPAGGPLVVTANVSDVAGNAATPATANITIDLTAPTLTIGALPFGAELNAAEDDVAQLISGTATGADGQTVTVTLTPASGAPVVLTSAAIAGGAWSVSATPAQLQGLAEGTVSISAAVSDAAGNPATPATGSFVKDSVAPTISITAIAGDGVINATELTAGITVTATTNADAGQTVTILMDNVAVGAGPAAGDGTFSVNIPSGALAGLANGATPQFRAEVTDPAGNPASATSSATVTTTPPVLTLGTIAADGVVNIAEQGAGFTVAGTTNAENGQVVTVTLTSGGFTTDATATVTGGAFTASFPTAALATLPTGPAQVTASVTNQIGNTVTTAPTAVPVDLEAPTLTIDNPLAGNNVFSKLNETNGLDVTGTTTGVEAGQIVTVTYNGVDYPTAPLVAATWTVTIPNTAFPGITTGQTITGITARVSDAAGNPSATATGPTLNVDLSGPSISINAIAADDVVNILERGSDLTVSGIASGADNQTATIEILNASNVVVFTATPTVTAGTGVWTITVPQATVAAFVDGTTLTVRANVSDFEGIVAPQATRNFATDYTSPSVAITTPISVDDIINTAETGAALTISGTTTGAQDGQIVSLTLGTGGAVVTAPVAANAWSVTLTPAQVAALAATGAEGTNLPLSASVMDLAGNPSTVTTVNVTADLTAPTIALNALPFGAELNAVEDNTDQTLSGTAVGADGQIVTLTLTPASGAPVILTSAAIAGGAWSVSATAAQLQGLAEGTVSISAAVSDAAGNPATPATGSFVKDATAPDLAISSVQSGGVDVGTLMSIAERDAGITISGTTSAENTQSVTVTITAPGPVTFDTTVPVTNGTWTATFNGAALAPLPDGAVITATATVSDAAGNPATPAAITTTSDFTPPTVTIDSHAVEGLVTGSSTGLAAGATVNLNVGAESFTATVDGAGAWQVQIPRAAGANSFQGLGQVFNQSLTSTATVADAAGNPGSATRDVTIYKEAGYFIAEGARTGTSATYQLFGNAGRTSEQVDIVINTADVSYVDAPASYSLRNDIVSFLSDVVPQTVNGEQVLRVSLTIDTTSPNYPQSTDVPLISLNLNFVGGNSDIAAFYRLRTGSADTYGGDSESWIGTSGVDTIAVNAIASAVRGMGGNDSINLSAGGENIVLFETTQALNGNDTIIGFQTGPTAKLPDTIGFAGLTNADLRGTGADAQQLAAGGTIGANTGFVILTTTVGDLSSATLETTAEGLVGEGGGDVLFLLASDGTNSALARVTYAGADDASVEVLGTFLGLANAGQVGTDQIFGFNEL